jgi:hypothetical protein
MKKKQRLLLRLPPRALPVGNRNESGDGDGAAAAGGNAARGFRRRLAEL